MNACLKSALIIILSSSCWSLKVGSQSCFLLPSWFPLAMFVYGVCIGACLGVRSPDPIFIVLMFLLFYSWFIDRNCRRSFESSYITRAHGRWWQQKVIDWVFCALAFWFFSVAIWCFALFGQYCLFVFLLVCLLGFLDCMLDCVVVCMLACRCARFAVCSRVCVRACSPGCLLV